MNWNSPYRDRFVEDPDLRLVVGAGLADSRSKCFPQPGVLIGGLGKESASQVAVWRRLIETSLSLQPDELWFDCAPEFLKSFLPRSLHHRVFLAREAPWPIFGHLAYAVVLKPSGRSLAFSGLPTEEGLDRLTEFHSMA